MKKFFSKKKNIVISCVVAVVLVCGIVGGVIYNNHVKEQRANELHIESINSDLQKATDSVSVLYSDDTYSFLSDTITQEELDTAKEAFDKIAEYKDSNTSMQDGQKERYEENYAQYTQAVSMNDIVTLYNSFYSSVEQPDNSVSSDSTVSLEETSGAESTISSEISTEVVEVPVLYVLVADG